MTFCKLDGPDVLTSFQSCCSLCLSVSDMGFHVLSRMSLLEVIFDSLFLFKFLFARQALVKKAYPLFIEIQDLE